MPAYNAKNVDLTAVLLVCDEQSLYESKPLTGDDVVLKQISLELARDVPPLLLVEVLVPKQPQREVHIHVLVRRDEIAMLHLTVHAHRKPAPETAKDIFFFLKPLETQRSSKGIRDLTNSAGSVTIGMP